MAGFTSQTATYLSLCLYVQIALLVLGTRYANDGSTLAVALGLCAVHGAMLELLQTFVVLSAALVVVDVYVFVSAGLGGWLIFLLVVNLVARAGSIWFGYSLAKEERDGDGMYQAGGAEVYVSPGDGPSADI